MPLGIIDIQSRISALMVRNHFISILVLLITISWTSTLEARNPHFYDNDIPTPLVPFQKIHLSSDQDIITNTRSVKSNQMQTEIQSYALRMTQIKNEIQGQISKLEALTHLTNNPSSSEEIQKKLSEEIKTENKKLADLRLHELELKNNYQGACYKLNMNSIISFVSASEKEINALRISNFSCNKDEVLAVQKLSDSLCLDKVDASSLSNIAVCLDKSKKVQASTLFQLVEIPPYGTSARIDSSTRFRFKNNQVIGYETTNTFEKVIVEYGLRTKVSYFQGEEKKKECIYEPANNKPQSIKQTIDSQKTSQ